MKIIIASKESNDQIQIDILKNPAIVRWFKHCQELQSSSSIISHLYHANIGKMKHPPAYRCQLLYNQLLIAIKKLQILLEENQITQFIFPEIPLKFNHDQIWCNHIHNIFIGLNSFLTDDVVVIEIAREIAREINNLIHRLEKWTDITENHQHLINNYSHCHLSTTGLKSWFYFTEEEQKLYHTTYATDKFYDVVFSNEILGKTFYRSFIDGEQSDSPAISGIKHTGGNLDIKLDSFRTDIFKDTRFKNWVKGLDINTETAPLEFPVGSINPNSNLDYFIKRKYADVGFYFL